MLLALFTVFWPFKTYWQSLSEILLAAAYVNQIFDMVAQRVQSTAA